VSCMQQITGILVDVTAATDASDATAVASGAST